MNRISVAIAVVLFVAPALSLAANLTDFEGGQKEVIASLNAPNFEATLNITVPADFRAGNATMKVTGLAAEGNASAYPDKVAMKLNDTVIWAFNGTGYGPLGRQDRFSTDGMEARLAFGGGGGTNKAGIRLPRDALVQSATMQLKYVPAETKQGDLVNFTGAAPTDLLGQSVSNAGDVNNDGYGDVIVGAANNDAGGNDAGRAYIHYGGANMDSTADVVFTGADAGDLLGFSVSGAGDVNNDGYHDVVVGAWLNETDGNLTGRVYIYYGGANMDSTADVVLTGKVDLAYFGYSVSGAGDVNNDGYDDVIVGEPKSNTTAVHAGRAYVYYGGANMDSTADVILNGTARSDGLGVVVSGAGDVNNDGYDDIIVGVPGNDSGGEGKGQAHVYYGGASMDSTADVTFSGEFDWDWLGHSVSGAGDVNNDGYDDVIIGAPSADNSHATGLGRAFIHYGNASMDSTADVTFTAKALDDQFGYSVSAAGDVNNDGYDDVIVGAHFSNVGGNKAGQVYVYYGNTSMDSTADVTFTGEAAGDYFGDSVSAAGDVNSDGYDEVIVGACNNDAGGNVAGRAYIYSMNKDASGGILDPRVAIGQAAIWNSTGYFNGTASTGDFANVLNDYLRSASGSGNDSFGNYYVDVPVNASAKCAGTIALFNLSVTYQYNASVPDFTSVLNDYLGAHQNEKDTSGNINVPIKIRSQSAGRIRLSGLDLAPNSPPALIKEIGTAEMDEDTWNLTIIDLYPYFQDDIDPDNNLDFSVVSASNSSYVRLWISGKRFLSADASTGDANDNWTGTVEATVACNDHWGQTTESNSFIIFVRNVNDPPEFTSVPDPKAEAGILYSYNVTAVDGDRDELRFSLPEAPSDMTIDAVTGRLVWMPRARGSHEVRVAVSDGTVLVEQAYWVVVPNKAPRITSTPPLGATTGIQYVYNVTAEDDNLDPLTFSVSSEIIGLKINATTGMVRWVPEFVREYDVEVTVSDGLAKAVQGFTIGVVQGNRAPAFKSRPVVEAMVDVLYQYEPIAADSDSDVLTYSLETGPAGMSMDASTRKITWTPEAAGNFTVVIKVADSKGAEARQEFVINVLPAVRPNIVLLQPPLDRKLTGIVTFSGTVTKGTREVIRIQMRVDEGEWNDAVGNYVWSFKLNTGTMKNGQHDFEFRAYDGKEYSDTLKVAYRVDHPAPEGSSSVLAEASMAGAIVASVTVLGFAYIAYSETAKFKMGLFFLPLYTRLQKEALLDNETRGMIRGCIITDPGIHYKAIMRNLKLSNGAAAYHLMTLEREGMVRSTADGHFKRFYPAEFRRPAPSPPLSQLQKLIMKNIEENEGISQSELSRLLEVPDSTVNRHVNKLADAGMLRLERHGMTIKCFSANGKPPENGSDGQV